MADKGFYRAFEDRYRGSRETIKERLKVYLPFILPFKDLNPDCKAFDLGCGRGEWLELMAETGFINPHGVDLDEDMLAACHERGLSVAKADAITSLQSLPDASHVIVSGFHIAEHIPFDALQVLVREALRVLKPGGLLILETPNPENIIVGTNNFYLDPTHQRPLPMQLLSFLAEYSGFARTKILRLQESQDLQGIQNVALSHVINGVSPDYAMVAQKASTDDQQALFDLVFDKTYGISLETLSSRYEAGIQQRFAEIEDRVLILWRIAAPLRVIFSLLRKARNAISSK
ncbi:MAG: class I SAM-dependent methyltransferase [Sulfuricella sp.]|nr:class I SAM-dependent methyltransferase [Sulfuricella sp.]